MPRKKKKAARFDSGAEVRAIARERVGAVPPGRVIRTKADRDPKHKTDLLAETES